MFLYKWRRVRCGCLFFVIASLMIIGIGCGRRQQTHTDRTRSGQSQSVAPGVSGGWLEQSPKEAQVIPGTKAAPSASGGWLDEAPIVSSTVPSNRDGSAQQLPREAEVAPETNKVAIGSGFGVEDGSDKVILAPGDAIETKFYYTPELDVNQVIRPDGYISMQLIGEVKAAGKTPADLGAELTTQYGWHLKNPLISIVVRSLYNRRVYVAGFIDKPGIVQMPGPMTLSEAIVAVGGFTEEKAKKENIIVVRNKGGQRQIFTVDMRDAKKVIPFELQPKDIVYVPQTRISKADQWVDQYLNQLIPNFIVTAWYPFGYPYR